MKWKSFTLSKKLYQNIFDMHFIQHLREKRNIYKQNNLYTSYESSNLDYVPKNNIVWKIFISTCKYFSRSNMDSYDYLIINNTSGNISKLLSLSRIWATLNFEQSTIIIIRIMYRSISCHIPVLRTLTAAKSILKVKCTMMTAFVMVKP